MPNYLASRPEQMLTPSRLERVMLTIAPRWALDRYRARMAAAFLARHYEAATSNYRTQNWTRASTDPNAAMSGAHASLRELAHDLVRNNPYAESAVSAIGEQAVGAGIIARALEPDAPGVKRWREWAETTACDADGRLDFYGIQALVMESVVESGEVLIRKRPRYLSDGLPIPIQLQVLEADHLDTSKSGSIRGGGEVIQGVEYDVLGKRAAYWLFPKHPGASTYSSLSSASVRVPASEVLHIFRQRRPGQVRAVSWFAPVLVRFKDFDEYEDATLVKQKIAACLAIITSDPDGQNAGIGTVNDTDTTPGVDTIQPGMIHNVAPGRTVDVVEPPSVSEHEDYTRVTLRGIATGLGIPYEDLTGDYTDMPFSAARMSRIRHKRRVERWQWRLLIPQLCDPVWAWAGNTVEAFLGERWSRGVRWSPPPLPMIDPDKEGLAIQRGRRIGLHTLQEAIRENGYDPDEVFAELQAENALLDSLGLVLDSDPRRMTQAGQVQSAKNADTKVEASVAP